MARLLDLPTEVLVTIAEMLCPHCTTDKLLCVRYVDTWHGLGFYRRYSRNLWGKDEVAAHATLANLAASSRRLRDVVQPIFFHSARLQDRWSFKESQWTRYISTLLRRPDLGRSVRDLQLQSWVDLDYNRTGLDSFFLVTQDLDKYEAKLIKSFSDPFPLVGPLNCPSKHPGPGDKLKFRLDQLYIHSMSTSIWNPQIPSSYLRLVLLACVPHIRRLLIDSERCNFWQLQPPQLPFLEEIGCRPSTSTGFSDLAKLSPILQAAPSLRRLRVCNIDKAKNVFHPGVTELHVSWSIFSERQFTCLVKAFPSVRIFHYQAGTNARFLHRRVSPAAIARALSLRAGTLEQLSLTLDGFDPRRHSNIIWQARITDLRFLVKLTFLEIEWTHVDDEALDFNREGLGVFPPTLRRLSIHAPPGLLDPGKVVAMIRDGRFPQLKHFFLLQWCKIQDREAALEFLPLVAEACNENGIQCSFAYRAVTDLPESDSDQWNASDDSND